MYQSIQDQTHPITLIVAYDSPEALKYIPEEVEKIEVKKGNTPCYYNLYCNKLKEAVTNGFFFFLDDDDFIANPKSIERIVPYLSNPEVATICQFTRNGRPKPPNIQIQEKKIIKGYIGMPCIFLHHSKKDIANFRDGVDADYQFIKDVSSRMKVQFVMESVVESPERSRGGME